jgi:hypothetical protein
MSPDEGPSNNIYADELVGATLDVITRPTCWEALRLQMSTRISTKFLSK